MVHIQLIGITKSIAGIMSAVGNILTLIIRKPVASIRKPPQALKSRIMAGVVKGKTTVATKINRKNEELRDRDDRDHITDIAGENRSGKEIEN